MLHVEYFMSSSMESQVMNICRHTIAERLTNKEEVLHTLKVFLLD